MTRTPFVQLAGIAGTTAGALMTGIIFRTWFQPFWMNDDDSTGLYLFLGVTTLVSLGVVGNASASQPLATRTMTSSAWITILLGLATLPIMLYGATFNWLFVQLGLYAMLLACILTAIQAIRARPVARPAALLLLLSTPLVPFMSTLDARVWLLLPFALAWILFGLSLVTWRGATRARQAA